MPPPCSGERARARRWSPFSDVDVQLLPPVLISTRAGRLLAPERFRLHHAGERAPSGELVPERVVRASPRRALDWKLRHKVDCNPGERWLEEDIADVDGGGGGEMAEVEDGENVLFE
ncbi:hypothetical protein G4B88_012837 [Cannabis sativa]|uniref:Uncharacterized protein n=1 Tax=Cannabis sativa TaxID=3483 RepID=A0A7J6EHP1_CANSA|nr:hypothetical protein G4B88_012837 [Cannabis sativa]